MRVKRTVLGLALGIATFLAMRAALHDDDAAISLGAAMFCVGFLSIGRSRC